MKCQFCQSKCQKLDENIKKSLGYELRENCWLYECESCIKQYQLSRVLFFVEKENFFLSLWKEPKIVDIHFIKITYEGRDFPVKNTIMPCIIKIDFPAHKFYYVKSEKLFYIYNINSNCTLYEITTRDINNGNFSPQDFKEKIDILSLLS